MDMANLTYSRCYVQIHDGVTYNIIIFNSPYSLKNENKTIIQFFKTTFQKN